MTTDLQHLQRATGKVCNTCDRALDDDTKRYWRRERPDLDTEYMKEVADWFFSCPEPACFPTGPGWEDRTHVVRVAGQFRGLLALLLSTERKEETSDD